MPACTRLSFLLLMALTTGAGAQHAPTRIAGPQPSEVLGEASRGPLRQSSAPDSVRREVRATHWKTGALIGGVVTGLGFALLIDGFCRSSDTGCGGGAAPQALLVGGVLGGLVGALVGGQMPKGEDP
jgi:hypothetical protein